MALSGAERKRYMVLGGSVALGLLAIVIALVNMKSEQTDQDQPQDQTYTTDPKAEPGPPGDLEELQALPDAIDQPPLTPDNASSGSSGEQPSDGPPINRPPVGNMDGPPVDNTYYDGPPGDGYPPGVPDGPPTDYEYTSDGPPIDEEPPPGTMDGPPPDSEYHEGPPR